VTEHLDGHRTLPTRTIPFEAQEPSLALIDSSLQAMTPAQRWRLRLLLQEMTCNLN
jgi:hypothetical protein